MGEPHTAGTALITGASSGIGQAIAQHLATHGYVVFGTSRRDLPDKKGVHMVRLDVRSDESIRRCVNQVLDRSGHIDLLVNNAGIMHEGFAEETSPERVRDVFETNLFGVASVINEILPGMRARRAGRIINVGSLTSWVGEPGEAFYAASKAALARYTEALRHEVWHLGIAVSLLEPGAFNTNILRASEPPSRAFHDYDGPREVVRATLNKSMRQGAETSKIAALVQRIAETGNPKPRYGAGREARWLPASRILIPDLLFERLLRRGYGLPTSHTGPRLNI